VISALRHLLGRLQKVRLRVDPAKPRFFVELVLDDDEWHRYPNG
jgi:hypothetical protein